MYLSALTRIEKNTRRLAEVLAILAKYSLADWLSGLNYPWLHGMLKSSGGQVLGQQSHEVRIRLALTELGTTYIKFGQMLSTRADLIGPALAQELGQLRSNTPPDAPDAVRATVQAELGRPVEELFAEWEDQALASGSIGQVHVARLRNGEAVVVKVQHADIVARIAGDLDIMAGLAELLQKHVVAARPYQPVATVREFRRVLLGELDFTSERRNLEEFARHFRGDAGVHFPAVFPSLCTRRVLTMERLVGVSGEDVDGLRRTGVDLAGFARKGAEMYLQMIFRNGFYHADPHAGNWMLLPDGVLGVLDCGMVGRIDDRLREDLEDLLLGVVQNDSEEVAGLLTRIGSVPAEMDHAAFRAEVAAFIGEYAGRPLRELDLSRALNEMTDIVRRYHIALPGPCALLLKTLVMLEGTSRQLSPTFSLAELIEPFEGRAVRRRFSPRRWLEKLQRAWRDWDRLLEVLPRDLAEVLRRIRSGTFEIRHEHHRLEVAVNRLVLGILAAGLFVSSGFLLSGNAPPALGGVSLFGLAGYLAGAAIAARLVWTIRKFKE